MIRILRFLILFLIAFLLLWAWIERNPETWNSDRIAEDSSSPLSRIVLWTQENLPQMQGEVQQLVREYQERMRQAGSGTPAPEIGGVPQEATSLPDLSTLPSTDRESLKKWIPLIIEQLKKIHAEDLAGRWEEVYRAIKQAPTIEEAQETPSQE